jgi:hypothetical protein
MGEGTVKPIEDTCMAWLEKSFYGALLGCIRITLRTSPLSKRLILRCPMLLGIRLRLLWQC